MTEDSDILQAVERLRDKWPALLGDEASNLADWLAEVSYNDPENVRQTTNRVLDLLAHYPQARNQINSELGVRGDLWEMRGYDPAPGGPSDVAPGTLMVCPVDPTHYQRRLQKKGQKLFCPQHNVALVPKE